MVQTLGRIISDFMSVYHNQILNGQFRFLASAKRFCADRREYSWRTLKMFSPPAKTPTILTPTPYDTDSNSLRYWLQLPAIPPSAFCSIGSLFPTCFLHFWWKTIKNINSTQLFRILYNILSYLCLLKMDCFVPLSDAKRRQGWSRVSRPKVLSPSNLWILILWILTYKSTQ